MSWQDFLLDDMPDERLVRRALAEVFDVTTEDIGIVRSSWPSTGDAPVRVVVHEKRGDFRCMLDVDIDDAVADADRVLGARSVCIATGATAFVFDDSYDPFSGFLIHPDGHIEPGKLDPDAEERGELRLWKGTS